MKNNVKVLKMLAYKKLNAIAKNTFFPSAVLINFYSTLAHNPFVTFRTIQIYESQFIKGSLCDVTLFDLKGRRSHSTSQVRCLIPSTSTHPSCYICHFEDIIRIPQISLQSTQQVSHYNRKNHHTVFVVHCDNNLHLLPIKFNKKVYNQKTVYISMPV